MIETVLGPISAEAVVAVNTHQHLLTDATALQKPAAQESLPQDLRVRPENLGFLRWNALALADNLRLDDPELAAAELAVAGRAVDLVIECTSWGLGPRHADLPQISVAAGTHVVCAYGFYVPAVLPDWAQELDEDSVYLDVLSALTSGVPGTTFRAGMVGIMGTTASFAGLERQRLRGAARAAHHAGVSVAVRLNGDARNGLEVISEMASTGLSPARILLSNADEYLDAAYWDDLLDAGVTLEMCFGTEIQHIGRMENPSDRERLTFFDSFLNHRPDGRWVLGGSAWTKTQLRAYGGEGYDHLTTRVLPQLRRRGVPPEMLQAMLTDEPRRLLDVFN